MLYHSRICNMLYHSHIRCAIIRIIAKLVRYPDNISGIRRIPKCGHSGMCSSSMLLDEKCENTYHHWSLKMVGRAKRFTYVFKQQRKDISFNNNVVSYSKHRFTMLPTEGLPPSQHATFIRHFRIPNSVFSFPLETITRPGHTICFGNTGYHRKLPHCFAIDEQIKWMIMMTEWSEERHTGRGIHYTYT